MEPSVTAMCSQDKKVRSLAKKVLGSKRMGCVCEVAIRCRCSWVGSPRPSDCEGKSSSSSLSSSGVKQPSYAAHLLLLLLSG
eukprot:scaffold144302_cov20-Tisochrysis_lutea.AAC.1